MRIKKWILLTTFLLLFFLVLGALGVVKLNELSAKAGSAVAQCNVGVFYENGWGYTRSEEKAIDWYLKSAEQGNSLCQYNLARILAKKKEYVTAFSWYLKAAVQNHSLSQYAVGKMFSDGIGTNRDMDSAAKWMTQAARQGLPQAQGYLATMYAKGEGVSYDLNQASLWAEKAAKNGDRNAAELLKLINNYQP